jgi:hypothetical protein
MNVPYLFHHFHNDGHFHSFWSLAMTVSSSMNDLVHVYNHEVHLWENFPKVHAFVTYYCLVKVFIIKNLSCMNCLMVTRSQNFHSPWLPEHLCSCFVAWIAWRDRNLAPLWSLPGIQHWGLGNIFSVKFSSWPRFPLWATEGQTDGSLLTLSSIAGLLMGGASIIQDVCSKSRCLHLTPTPFWRGCCFLTPSLVITEPNWGWLGATGDSEKTQGRQTESGVRCVECSGGNAQPSLLFFSILILYDLTPCSSLKPCF